MIHNKGNSLGSTFQSNAEESNFSWGLELSVQIVAHEKLTESHLLLEPLS